MQSIRNGFARVTRAGKQPLQVPWGNMRLFVAVWGFIWVFASAAFGASIQFWIPGFFWYEINLMSLVFNSFGAFTIAWVTVLDQARFQYMQTYLIYDGIKMGFLSVMTTFGHVISDTDRLLHFGRWWPSPLNLIMTLTLAFLCYELGRLAALKFVTGNDFSMDLMKMENEERRMAHELDMQFNESGLSSERNDGTMGAGIAVATEDDGPYDETEGLLHGGEHDEDNHDNALLAANMSAVDLPAASRPADEAHDPVFKVTQRDLLDAQVKRMVQKRMANSSPWPQFTHIAVLCFMLLVPIVSGIIAAYTKPIWFPSETSKSLFLFEFLVSLTWSIAGATLGSYMNPCRGRPRYVVQWGTFRVNMLSCILIGTAHNILLFRHYFPGSSDPRFYIVFARFITDFCGSLSSFAGLIDETATLFNSRCPTKVAVRNLSYNFFLCLTVFALVVYIVGLALVFR